MANNRNAIATQKQSFSTFMALPAVKQKVYDIVAGKDGDRFITSIVTAVGTNPQLAACDYSSILSAALLGEALKLSPSPQLGQFYMVPYNDNNRKIKVAQFQLGYKGYIQLAIRSGQYRDIDVISIKEGELISYDPFRQKGEFKAVTDPIEREKAETIGYYAYFELLNGFRKEMYWSKEQMLAHAKQYSQGYASDLRKGTSYTFWAKNFDGMAQKTMLRQLISKWGLMSIEMQQAFTGDTGTIREDGSVDYIDNTDDAIFKDVTPIEEDAPALQESEPMSIPDPDDDVPLPFDMGDQQSIEQMFFG
jgi:recombination protein RecT